ncbi:glycosyltransferase family 4 protein [Streptomyces phaeochromogenes]|uniref:glycosyltransferase family 4 protein n=1 Tax=Streptomyces phaeochromogenes TaxID=1923 RepID=UPI00386A0893|nr:glycosyltransferase family 4 protein [Streptomyces phaeochromogenes]
MLSQADVYAHTALWEGAPMTLLEAMGLGRPVVARRIPALESLGCLVRSAHRENWRQRPSPR